MANYLVTGAAGFIGARVVAHLLESGHKVSGIDNLNDAYDVRLKQWRIEQLGSHPHFTFLKADITERSGLEEVWGDETFAAVLNLAARAGVRQSLRNPYVYYHTNVIGTLNLLHLCREKRIAKLIQASTSSLYGAHNPRPFREDADISRPLSPYAASKGAAELLCHTYNSLYGMDITIMRYFTVYGPAGRPDMSIFRFIQWMAEDRPLVLYGDGQQERDFTFIEDIARGTVLALDQPGFEVVNLGGDRPTKIIDVINRIETLLGKKAKIDSRHPSPGDVKTTWADVGKAKTLFDWEPRIHLDEGLQSCVDWYLAEKQWASQIDTKVFDNG
jgi:nucleoside-diphosphate-sugar epimerase